MFQIKICGVTSVADAVACCAAGSDAVGLNFCPSSPRFISLDMARDIAAELPAAIVKVGVFVNASSDEIRRACDLASLDVIQLHGDETSEMLASLSGRAVIKAFRCRRHDAGLVQQFLGRCDALGSRPAAVLIDAALPGAYGGTGQLSDWNLARDLSRTLGEVPVILAGGLGPANIAAAIAAVRPAAVDTASGVESSPGRKDAEQIRQFVSNAREAFSRLPRR